MVHKIDIRVDAVGRGHTVLNGQDISEIVSAIGLNTDIDTPTEVTLVLTHLDVHVFAEIEQLNVVERRLLKGQS